MTAQDLKNAILQLAVQGKLVPQDPTDEPASELLKRVQAEKAQLVKEGKIKKDKMSTDIKDAGIPFDIPETWTWVPVLSITYPVGNKDNQILASEVKKEGRFPAISQGQSLVDGYCDDESRLISDIPVILFGDHTRNVKYIDFPFVISADGTKLLKPVGIYPQYFFWWTVFTAEQLRNRGYARHFTLLKEQPVSLPPLAEQHRIVAKIEELLPLVEEYAAAEKRLTALNAEFPDKLRKSILQQAVMGKLTERDSADEPVGQLLKRIKEEKERLVKEGKLKKEKLLPVLTEDDYPFDIPDEWEWVRLTDVGEVSRGRSKNRPRNDPSLFIGGIHPFIQTGDVAQSTGIISECNSFYNEKGLAQSRMWPKGTLCLTIAANIGDVGILDFEACFPDSVIGFNAFSPIESNKYFLYMLMAYKTVLDSRATKSAQKNINLETIASLAYPLPPLAEQQRIVVRVEELLAVCNRLK